MIDVVIIGGGPAGITAGVVLQKEGYRTCIIDNRVFPREKLCAGVITSKAIKLIHSIYKGLDLNNLEINYINKVSTFYKGKNIGNYVLENSYGVIDRRKFDSTLLKFYKHIGGIVLEGQKKYQILFDKNKVVLSDGKELKYCCLIGADGINSRVRPYVQHKWRASILCFEKFIPNESKEDIIKIYFGDMLGGYGWRIPGKNRIGIGLGEFYFRGRRRDINKYKAYFGGQGVEDLLSIKGAFVSMGNYVKHPVKNNVILVGDAAGLVDAMSGEGIFFAMESGKQAALAFNEFKKSGKSISEYTRRIRMIHKKMDEQNMYNKMLYVPGLQKLCIKYMRENPLFVQRVMDNAISSYKSGYTKELMKT